MKFTQVDGIIEYENPFESSKHRQTKFKRVSPEVFEVENGMILKVSNEQYDYLVDGNLITQRCGASQELLEKLIKHNVKARDYDLMLKISKGEV